MKYVRLWFVALVVVALLRSEPVYTVEVVRLTPSSSMWIDLNEAEPEAAPPMPDPEPWFSFLDQTTGTWRGAQ